MAKLQEIIQTFQSVDPPMRVELLLDYARQLPPLPAGSRYDLERQAGINRVPECMTPVFLWVEPIDGQVRIIADVAEEAPTVKGFVAILVEAFSGSTPQEIAAAPADLIGPLGLGDLIRMTRTVGLSAVLARIKREAQKLSV